MSVVNILRPALCSQTVESISVLYIFLIINSDYFPIQHLLTAFYDADEHCSLCSTDLIFKSISLNFQT
jgi:hypothetical protein